MLGAPDILASARRGRKESIADLVRRGGRQGFRAVAQKTSAVG